MRLFRKTNFIILFGIIFLTSCFELRFTSSLPLDKEELKMFPPEMIGKYELPRVLSNAETEKLIAKQKEQNDTIKKLTLEIKQHSFLFPFYKEEIRIDNETGTLKQYNDTCYIFSHKNETNKNKTWSVFPFTYSNNKITIYSNIFTPKTEHQLIIDSINHITDVKTVYKTIEKKKKKKNKEVIDYWLINPTKEEFDSLFDAGIFPIWVEFEKIK